MLPVAPSIKKRISAPAGERASGVSGNGQVCMGTPSRDHFHVLRTASRAPRGLPGFGLDGEPTRGLEPRTPSLRVRERAFGSVWCVGDLGSLKRKHGLSDGVALGATRRLVWPSSGPHAAPRESRLAEPAPRVEPVTSGLQIQSGAGPRPSASAVNVSGSEIGEFVWSAPAALGQRDLTQI
jgi:hypothetical protein